jgi:hypothetical protein
MATQLIQGLVPKAKDTVANGAARKALDYVIRCNHSMKNWEKRRTRGKLI